MDVAARCGHPAVRALLVTVVLLLRVAAADPPKGNTEPAISADLQWTQFRHEVFTNRGAQLDLARARRMLESGSYPVAFETLQKGILGDPQELLTRDGHLADGVPDSFFWDGRRLRSVRREAIRLLDTVPVKVLRDYEKQWGPIAAEALKSARRSGSLPALMEVARRCFPTQAGAVAIDLAATRLLDEGYPTAAAQMWDQLIQSPVHRPRLQAGLFRKAAMAWLMSGHPQRAEDVMARGHDYGYSFALADIREAADLQRQVSRQHAGADWPLPFGDTTNNPITRGTVPYLQPLWTQSLAGARDYDALSAWEDAQIRSELDVVGAAVWPIIASGQLIVRDVDGVRACDPFTGQMLWRFNATLSSRELSRRFRMTGFAPTAGTAVEYAWAKAPEIGAVTSDGERVFALDWTDMRVEEQADASIFFRGYTGTNRIVCLPIPSASAITDKQKPLVVAPLWTAGGTMSNPDSDVLSGYLFLGPPVPMAGAVFVIAESLAMRELSLIKLEAATGRVVWVQQLGLVEQNIFDSGQKYRFNPVSIPACSGNTIVCSTEARYVVAVDATTGELLWMYDYADRITDFRSRSRSQAREQGYRGLPDPPHIQGNSLLLLPRRSAYMHCVDLKTGGRVWRVKRDDDLYVAAATETVVATVGRQGMRGLSLRDGKELWKTRLGLPSGRGVRTQLRPVASPAAELQDTFLLPLKRGSIAAVNLESGEVAVSTTATSIMDRRFAREHGDRNEDVQSLREIDMRTFGLGSDRPSPQTRPGNLLLHDGLAFSVGPQHVTAFAQVGDLLRRLRASSAQATPDALLELARVELAAGDDVSAEQRLLKAIAAGGQPSERARWTLQELFRERLTRPDSQLSVTARRNIIDRLVRGARTPREQEQALIQLARWELQHGSPARAVPHIATIDRLEQNSFVSLQPFSEQTVASEAWGRRLVAQAIEQSTPAERNFVRQQIERDFRQALEADTVASLEHFVSVYASAPQAGPVRNRLADRLIQDGQFQSAELLLLTSRRSSNREVRAVAEALLACLWDRLQIPIEAGHSLRTLATQYSDVSLNTLADDRLNSVQSSVSLQGRTSVNVESFLRSFRRSSSSWRVFQALQPLDWRVHSVGINNTPLAGSNPDAPEVWRKAPRRVDISAAVGFDIFRTGGTLGDPQHQWILIDRHSGASRAAIDMPDQTPLPVSRYRYVGHLMPVGGRKDFRAISLLESNDGAPFWKHQFRPVEDTLRDAIEPSVATPSVFVFQTVKHLFGIEPRTGRVLWRRSDLDLECGVRVDREAGLFGDSESLTLFHSDGERYSVLSSVTGETLRTGRADVDFSNRKRVFGRKLLHVTEGNTLPGNQQKPRRVRVWDPVTNRFNLDIPIAGRLDIASSKSGEELAIVLGDRLMIFHTPDMQPIATIDFGPEDLARMTTVRMFSDDHNIYLNLQERASGLSTGNRNYYLAGESSLPLDNVFKGSLLAVSRETGTVLWKRPVQSRSVLNMTHCSLPFLIGVSRISPRARNTRRALELEIIDRDSGETIGHSDRLIPDRIVHARVDRDQGVLTLHGLTSRINLDFSRRRQAIPVEPGPL